MKGFGTERRVRGKRANRRKKEGVGHQTTSSNRVAEQQSCSCIQSLTFLAVWFHFPSRTFVTAGEGITGARATFTAVWNIHIVTPNRLHCYVVLLYFCTKLSQSCTTYAHSYIWTFFLSKETDNQHQHSQHELESYRLLQYTIHMCVRHIGTFVLKNERKLTRQLCKTYTAKFTFGYRFYIVQICTLVTSIDCIFI